MRILRATDIPPSEITPERLYWNRREFIRAAGGAALAATVPFSLPTLRPDDDKLTPYEDITTYNNYYEFGYDKSDPSRYAAALKTRPWTVAVEGEVKKPKVFDVDELLRRYPAEERIYRLRCVEAWSMVIPWSGFALSKLLNDVQPTSFAKYVAFTTVYRPAEMRGQNTGVLAWPYVEGLRLDEAMHPLTLLCVGMYGETLPNQDGAPVRMVVPWKYGYKSIKSIVKIKLQEREPPTTWNLQAPNEYGFYSNVNPNVEHPRWSQATERRLGEIFMRKTLMFNGYADQVAALYAGMDLKKFH